MYYLYADRWINREREREKKSRNEIVGGISDKPK